MSPITTKRHGDILIVTSNNPPVNALGHAVRVGLVAGGNHGEQRPVVRVPALEPLTAGRRSPLAVDQLINNRRRALGGHRHSA